MAHVSLGRYMQRDLLQCLHFLEANWDITLRVSHIPGAKSIAADAISRNSLQVCRWAAPEAEKKPIENPRLLWETFNRQYRLDITALAAQANVLLAGGLTPSTVRVYETGKKATCDCLSLAPLPEHADFVCG